MSFKNSKTSSRYNKTTTTNAAGHKAKSNAAAATTQKCFKGVHLTTPPPVKESAVEGVAPTIKNAKYRTVHKISGTTNAETLLENMRAEKIAQQRIDGMGSKQQQQKEIYEKIMHSTEAVARPPNKPNKSDTTEHYQQYFNYYDRNPLDNARQQQKEKQEKQQNSTRKLTSFKTDSAETQKDQQISWKCQQLLQEMSSNAAAPAAAPASAQQTKQPAAAVETSGNLNELYDLCKQKLCQLSKNATEVVRLAKNASRPAASSVKQQILPLQQAAPQQSIKKPLPLPLPLPQTEKLRPKKKNFTSTVRRILTFYNIQNGNAGSTGVHVRAANSSVRLPDLPWHKRYSTTQIANNHQRKCSRGSDENDEKQKIKRKSAAAAKSKQKSRRLAHSDSDDDYDDLHSDNNGYDLNSNYYNNISDSPTSETGRSMDSDLKCLLQQKSSKLQTEALSQEDEVIGNPKSVLVNSLFPHVPPFVAFSTSTSKGPPVPAELYRIFKWRISSVTPKCVRLVLANSGMRILKKSNDWMGVWGRHTKAHEFRNLRSYQKMNHLPGSFKIGRKDACWRCLQKQMAKHGRRCFGFMPKTFLLPHDLTLFRKSWPKYAERKAKWIIKPPAGARGSGIHVVSEWCQIPKRRPIIVQKYIERPLLINGTKFDLRLYVLVTSINPLRVYMYRNGLARFATVKYSDKLEKLNDRCMHLTNYSINKFSQNYAKNEDFNACHGHKWTIKSLWEYLANRGVCTIALWATLRNLVLRTLLAAESTLSSIFQHNVESKYSCYELFGFDILLDANIIPWLLEVNISPSLHSDLPLDAHVKAPLVQAVLNTALFNVPPKLQPQVQKELAFRMFLPYNCVCFDKRIYINYLSRNEKIKHTMFTRKPTNEREAYLNAIIDELTPDDVRCLIVAEDELARSAPLERIFPTVNTYKYLKYTETARYYNRLLDAWETRYAANRLEGITRLRSLCDRKVHLQVPTSPLGAAVSEPDDDQTTTETTSDVNVSSSQIW